MSKSISDNARDEAAIQHANKYVAIPRHKLALETWQLSIRDDFKSGWDAALKHQAETVAGEFDEEDLEDAAQAYAYEHDTGGEPLEDFKAGALFQFNKDRERLAVLTLANKIHFENETALRARLARALEPRHYDIKNSQLKEENEKLKRELAEKDALLKESSDALKEMYDSSCTNAQGASSRKACIMAFNFLNKKAGLFFKTKKLQGGNFIE